MYTAAKAATSNKVRAGAGLWLAVTSILYT
jgi:hypothetical protein